MQRFFFITLSFIAGSYFALAHSAHAQSNLTFEGVNLGDQGTLEIVAGTLFVDQDTNRATFSDSVTISQGNTRLTAQKATVLYDETSKTIQTFKASGRVQFLVNTDKAEAQTATLNVPKRELTLSGQVKVQQGPFSVSAQSAKINLKTGRVVLEGNVTTRLP